MRFEFQKVAREKLEASCSCCGAIGFITAYASRRFETRPPSGFSALRDIIGRDRIITLNNGDTVGKLLDELEGNFGLAYRDIVGEGLAVSLRKRFSMLLSGVFMSPEQNLGKALNNDDAMVFFQLAGA